MQKKHSKTIGILVEITREFGRGLCRGISEFARETDAFTPQLISARDLKDPARLRAFDGFIARVMTDQMAATLAATGRPVVDVYYEKPRDGFAIVKTRHSRVGTLAAHYYLDRLFKNFAFCGYAGGRFSTYCRAAFVHALAKHGATCDCYEPAKTVRYGFDARVLIDERLQNAPDERKLLRWIQSLPKPVAMFCPHDMRAWQVVQVCKKLGVDVPHELAILGLDNDILVCGMANPMISSIDPDCEGIGRRAAETLNELIAKPSLAAKRIVRQVEPTGVVERTSTATYPFDPQWLSDALIFIGHNLDRQLSASDVYREVGLSHTLVDRTFRKKLGTTVQKQIAIMRLDRARQLLSTRLTLAEIAPLCGFASVQYLIKSFSGRFGIPPAAWRAREHPHPTVNLSPRVPVF